MSVDSVETEINQKPENKPENPGILQSISFLNSLFVPGDRILIRPVETWTEDNRKSSRVDYRGTFYLQSPKHRLRLRWAAAREELEKTNTFFGVCPRFGTGGEFDKAWQIRTVRSLWADIDHTTVDDVLKRIGSAELPRPSIIVSSGNGVHVYWLLDTPFLIDDVGNPPAIQKHWIEANGKKRAIEYFINPDKERVYLQDQKSGKPIKKNEPDLSPKAVWIEDILKGIANVIGGDHTFDLSRLLRLPGTLNRKDQRNGKEPRPCVMVQNNDQRHSIELFTRFAELSPSRKQREKIKSVPLPSRKRMTGQRRDKLASLIWACGNAPAGERSELDYQLCCWAIEHGLTSAEIWPQVARVGKFAERGEDYFLRTWEKAENQTRCKFAAKVERSCGTSSRAEPDPVQAGNTDDRIEIEVTTKEHKINNDVVDVLRADDSLYQRGGQLVNVVHGAKTDGAVERPDDVPRIAALPLPIVRDLISKHVNFYTEVETKDGPQKNEQHVPDWCARAVHARGEWKGIRPLQGIVNHPVVKPDGTILTQPGYDSQTGLILHWVGEPLSVLSEPTRADAIASVSRLKKVIADFPFESDAHRTGWLALLLTVLIRHAFRHAITAPLFLLDASIRGSGKTLLADLVGMIVCGFALPRMILPKDDDEMRKHMLCLAMAGDEFALFDNVAGELGGQTLDAVLTGTQFKGRVLGESRDVSVAMNTTFVATANNCTITGDLCRRTIHIRLSSSLENPEERDDFQIPNILQHVRAHRNELLTDALTIVRAYCVAGKPVMKLSMMGSFEDWSAMVRNPLVWSGEADPWETRLEFAKRADSNVQTLAELLRTWRPVDPDDTGVTVAQLLHRLEANPLHYIDLKGAICDLCNCKAGAMPGSKLLGKRLSSIRDRVYRGHRLVSDPNRDGVMVWRVEAAEPQVRGVRGVRLVPRMRKGVITIPAKKNQACITSPRTTTRLWKPRITPHTPQ